MWASANAAKQNGAKITGVMPEMLYNLCVSKEEACDSFYVTVDKDKDKKARKDKYGRKHLILIIRDAEFKEMPRKSYSLEDLDSFAG